MDSVIDLFFRLSVSREMALLDTVDTVAHYVTPCRHTSKLELWVWAVTNHGRGWKCHPRAYFDTQPYST